MLRDIYLKKTYSSENDNLLQDFYIPTLKEALNYKRITGFFSSTSLLLASRGIAHFFSNGGNYDLISGVLIENKDYEAIVNGLKSAEDVITNNIEFDPETLENELEKDHLKILSWLISTKRLRIKIAILPEKGFGIFHEKVGIFEDRYGNKISFSGSINESGAGWLGNIEEFKVFRGWVEEEVGYLERDLVKFSDYWNNRISSFSVIDLPEALEKKILKIRPESEEIVKQLVQKIQDEQSIRKIGLYDFQREAIKAWEKNNCLGVLEMATGTGKTLTSFGCVNQRFKANQSSIIIIAAPQVHLVKQWEKELIKVVNNGIDKDFGYLQKINTNEILILNGANINWKRDLSNALIDFKSGIRENLIIITTHDTLSSEFCINKLNNVSEVFIIIDEVHGIGAPKLRLALLQSYTYRLGLSATPERWMDEEGTKYINDYFEKTVYKFTIEDAIKKINPKTGKPFLTPYNYLPYFVELTQEEKEDYIELSKKIAKSFAINSNNENNSIYTSLLIKRANILKSAVNKEIVLENIINDLKKNSDLKDILVYCNPGDQFKNSLKKLQNMKIKVEKFTNEEGVAPDARFNGLSEREYILKMFSVGFYQILVAMRCLDEGVDIPSAKYGILMASSTNPREFIQRRGRLLRYYPGKNKAYIYDVIVVPPKLGEDEKISDLDKKIYEKEMQRYKEFAKIADNSGECLLKLVEIEKENKIYE